MSMEQRQKDLFKRMLEAEGDEEDWGYQALSSEVSQCPKPSFSARTRAALDHRPPRAAPWLLRCRTVRAAMQARRQQLDRSTGKRVRRLALRRREWPRQQPNARCWMQSLPCRQHWMQSFSCRQHLHLQGQQQAGGVALHPPERSPVLLHQTPPQLPLPLPSPSRRLPLLGLPPCSACWKPCGWWALGMRAAAAVLWR